MQKVLVAGAGGFLGGYVVDALADRFAVTGYDVKALKADIPRVTGDVMNLSDLEKACCGMDAVIHIAAVPNKADIRWP